MENVHLECFTFLNTPDSARHVTGFELITYTYFAMWCNNTLTIVCILGSYMSVTSNIGQVGDQVTLLSPKMKTLEQDTYLLFWYHMWISDDDKTAALTVYTYSELHVYERRLTELRGNRGSGWYPGFVCIPKGTYQLAFVATHGLQFLSDIAVDDIRLYEYRCYQSIAREGKYFTDTSTK